MIAPTMNRLVWLGWNQTSLPRVLRGANIDIYHSVKQIGAVFSKIRKTVTIQDACYILFPEAFGVVDRTYWRLMQRQAASRYDFIFTVSNSASDCIRSALSVSDDRNGVTYLVVDHAAFDKSPVDAQTEARVRAKYSLPESFIFCLVRMMKTEIDKWYAQAARYTYEDCARQTLHHYERIANS